MRTRRVRRWAPSVGVLCCGLVGAAGNGNASSPPASTTFAGEHPNAPTEVAFDPVLPLTSCSGGGAVLVAPAAQGVARTVVQFEGEESLGNRSPQGAWCPGYATATPQLCLRVSRAAMYYLQVTDSESLDTVMALVDHEETLQCDDDSGGSLRPALTVWLEPGAYSVWVGPYTRGNAGRAQVEVSPH